MDSNANCVDVLLNGRPMSDWGGAALLDYTIGETGLTFDVFQGLNRTTWRTLKKQFGLRPVEITVVFRAETLREAKRQSSAFCGALFDGAELFIPDDGFFYTVYPESLGAEELVGIGAKEAAIKRKFRLQGIRHDALRTETVPGGGLLYCLSTMPFTDCRLTATAGAAAQYYQLGGCVFGGVAAGDVLVFDGINGAVTKNGVSAAANASWTQFAALTPGENLIQAADPVTVEYAPTYI